MSFLIHSSLVWPLTIESLRFTILSYKIPLPPLKNNTVFENHRKSLMIHCERSELRLHFEWTKVNKNAKNGQKELPDSTKNDESAKIKK